MSVVEIDIRKYFNTIPHQELMKMLLRTKISDRCFLKLIEILITAPVMENEQVSSNLCVMGAVDGVKH